MQVIEIADARTRVGIVPGMGAGLAFMEARLPEGPVPVLRPWQGSPTDPFGLGCILLLPFCNRLFGGGITFGGVSHPVAPNLTGEAVPHHGGAFQRAWQVVSTSPGRAELVLPEGTIGPWRYRARVIYEVEEGTLVTSLEIVNLGPELPFGAGFHPWFQRAPETRLELDATGVWLPGAGKRPTHHIALADRPEWDFRTPRSLPGHTVDTAFTGWPGRLRIIQRDITVELSAGPELGLVHLYMPRGEGFFCAEPVSHPVNAMNMPRHPGMAVLPRGGDCRFGMTLGWAPVEAPAASASYISAER